MDNFDLKKYLAEGNLLKEALNKPMNEFGRDLEKRLNTLGFETKLFIGKTGVPQEAIAAIIEDPKKAGVSYFKYPEGHEYISVVVNSSEFQKLKKVKSYFQTANANYSPDKKIGWVLKNVKVTNPGDIIGSEIARNQWKAELTYYTSSSDGEKVKTRDVGTSTIRSENIDNQGESNIKEYDSYDSMGVERTDEYDTDGYVEAMGPDLDEHVDAIVRIFKEWKEGPATEPGMEGYAKDDLVNYLQRKIRNA